MWQLFLDDLESNLEGGYEFETREDWENYIESWSNNITDDRNRIVNYYKYLDDKQLKELGVEFERSK